MTTPSERFRALCWGLEMLQAMLDDDCVPAALQSEALELLKGYPDSEKLTGLLRVGGGRLPPEWGEVIDATTKLFERLHFSARGSESTRRYLLFTQRHFPLAGEAPNIARFGDGRNIRWWIDL